ncbi:BAG family molecular chaperone regulator 3 [Apostasia shenzhenica]|uniref:BAG family molecular chaperone regulator 3 n=1 Tax=Apostasia shenzhenica TaxID=1088818 RepID=A0A2I0BEZ7_9ASPA|nr:BAG family molecular chaperone regulator 3 [Apostasia shenzhenica]
MMRRRPNGFSSAPPQPPPPPPLEWEVLPGGMLVQKRTSATSGIEAAAAPVPVIRVRVKHGLTHHEIYLSSQSSFGELKKLLTEKTGLHPQEQRIFFKDRERDSSAFLDIAGVKDGARMVVEDDPTARAKRLLEKRAAARAARAGKDLCAVASEVDRLASRVSELEAVVGKVGRMEQKEVVELTELLMAQLVRLDAIAADDSDAEGRKRTQVRRVQRCVEKLDMMKLKNSESPTSPSHLKQKQQCPSTAVATTKWETFDSINAPMATATTSSVDRVGGRLEWELF